MRQAPPVLPPVLLREFTAAEAQKVGVGVRQLARLRRAGLAVQDGECFRIVDPGQQAAIALAAVGQPAALRGLTAARQYGWLDDDPDANVHLLVPRDRYPRPWPGALVHRGDFAGGDLLVAGGIRLTAPARTALDAAGSLELVESLPMLDRLLRDEIVEPDELEDALADRPRWSGRARAATAVGLSDARHASHPESVFRALVHNARLPAPAPQFPVRLDGVLVGRADFAWPRFRLLVEIDGYEFHKEYAVFIKDRQRGRKAWKAGWSVLHFAAAEVLDDAGKVIADVRAALALAAVR